MIKQSTDDSEVKALVQSIKKHKTDTTGDLILGILRESHISNFGVAVTSLARCIKHLVLGIFSFLPFLNFDELSPSIYFHRAFVDLGGFGIGLVGTLSPETASEMARDFLKFSWKNS